VELVPNLAEIEAEGSMFSSIIVAGFFSISIVVYEAKQVKLHRPTLSDPQIPFD
jgi:hypothetical protein